MLYGQASVYCEVCHEDFCTVCFAMLHRTGSRLRHRTRALATGTTATVPSAAAEPVNADSGVSTPTADDASQNASSLIGWPILNA